MKSMKKLLVLLVAFAMAFSCLFSVACGEKEEHECGHVCTVCGKCTDATCEDPVCEEKCPGHTTPDPDPTPDEHECEHVCPEAGCGKCLDKDCTDPACAEKCPGHGSEEEHECKDPCPTCGKCTTECTDPACKDKCEGNHNTEEEHECKDKCPVCDKCTTECEEPECEEKCPGHEDEDDEDEYTVTFETTNGAFTGTIDGSNTAKTVKGKLTSLPDVTPDGNNVRFLGWYTEVEEGEKVTTEYAFSSEEKEVTVYAHYKQEYVITLNAGDEGTLSASAKTTYVTVDGKIDLAGERYLPEPTSNKTHWFFMDWCDGETVIDEETTVFTKDTVLTAKYGRESGVWSGENADEFKIALVKNNGAATSPSGLLAEYWFGGASTQIHVTKDERLTLYLDGVQISHHLDGAIGVEGNKPNGSKSDYVTVTVEGDLNLYLKLYYDASDPNNYVCQWLGASEVGEGDESTVAGCAPINITWGSNSITFYLKDVSGNPVGESDLSKFALYTYSPELFGSWANTPTSTTGLLSSTMTSTQTSMPTGWIFRWGSFSGDSNQTADILTSGNNMVSGGTYLVELVAKNVGASKVTAITLS